MSTLKVLVQKHLLGWHLIDKYYVLMPTSRKQYMRNEKSNTEFAGTHKVKCTVMHMRYFPNAISSRYFCTFKSLELVVQGPGAKLLKLTLDKAIPSLISFLLCPCNTYREQVIAC